MTAAELPDSNAEYERYRDYDPETAFLTPAARVQPLVGRQRPVHRHPGRQRQEAVVLPDVPEPLQPASTPTSPATTTSGRCRSRACSATTTRSRCRSRCTEQDLKYFRDPIYAYGDWVSGGETSKCQAFTDNPGNALNWNNNLEQYLGSEAWQSYLIHGGGPGVCATSRTTSSATSRASSPSSTTTTTTSPSGRRASTPATTPTPSRSSGSTRPARAATRSPGPRTAPRRRSGTPAPTPPRRSTRCSATAPRQRR